MTKKIGVVLVSGGMDSLVVLAKAIQENDEIAALHLNYKQRTEQKELQAFTNICSHYHITKKLIVDVSHFQSIGGSSLTDKKIDVEKVDLQVDENSAEIPSSYVPFRNANILCIATSWAEVLQASSIYIGAVEEDAAGYPDCREVFYDAFNALIAVGTKPSTRITIKTPLIKMNKRQIVLEGIRLRVPFEHSWSCYSSEDKACGMCDSCARRLRGFREAEHQDPIPYQVDERK